jgi:hypothetical protein
LAWCLHCRQDNQVLEFEQRHHIELD